VNAGAIGEFVVKIEEDFLLPFQRAWIRDGSPLKIMEKSRQVGATWTDALDSVLKACEAGARLDVWVSSRDEKQARLYLRDCMEWAKVVQEYVKKDGEWVFTPMCDVSAEMVEFGSGRRIYSVSSNPDALAGKRGHVKLDEFALHQDARMLYQVAKPVTTWGGQLSIISTHRGAHTVFNEIIREIKEGRDQMGWGLHTVPLQKAVEQGLVEKISEKTRQSESRDDFLQRLCAECIDEEQWLQEYCCVPADESAAFITFDMITACEDPSLSLLTLDELLNSLMHHASPITDHGPHSTLAPRPSSLSAFYLGLDVARKHDLCVIDVGEKIGDVVWDRMRLELQGRKFSEIEAELYRLLRLPQVKRACIDATGMGMQLAERAAERFAWKVEPITFTAAVKEELAFSLRSDFEERRLRIVSDDKLRSDLRGIKKEVSLSGNIRFLGESKEGHCDRFWAKALRQQAARYRVEVGAAVG